MRGRILVVEDHALTAKAMGRLLRHLKFTVDLATTVAAARKALADAPDCVVLDLLLGDGHGLEILREIRESGRDIKVAVVTGSGALTPLSDVRSMEPDALFIKPVQTSALVEWVEAHCCHQTDSQSVA